jgi:hypothetical protein
LNAGIGDGQDGFGGGMGPDDIQSQRLTINRSNKLRMKEISDQFYSPNNKKPQRTLVPWLYSKIESLCKIPWVFFELSSYFSVDIGVSTVSGSFAQGQILILFVLYLSNFLCNEYDIILVDFLFFWIFQNGFFLLLFHVSPNRYCVTLHLHVINHGLPTIKYLGFAYNEELLHHTVQ